MKKAVVLALLAVTILGVSACGKEQEKPNKDDIVGTLEIMQYDLGDKVQTKDGFEIILHSVKAMREDKVHEDNIEYELDMTVKALEKQEELKGDSFVLDNEGIVQNTDISFKNNENQRVKIKFCMPKDVEEASFTYTGESSKIWNLTLPDLSTFSTN